MKPHRLNHPLALSLALSCLILRPVAAASVPTLNGLPGWHITRDPGVNARLVTTLTPERRGVGLLFSFSRRGDSVTLSHPLDPKLGSLRSQALRFWVKASGSVGLWEVMLIDDNGTVFGLRRSFPVHAAQWTEVMLPFDDFEYFWGADPTFHTPREIQFRVVAAQAEEGELSFSDIHWRMVPSLESRFPRGMLEDGHSVAAWQPIAGGGNSLNLSVTQGRKGEALVAYYLTSQNQRVSLKRRLPLRVTSADVLLVSLKGEGTPNRVDLRLTDEKDTQFGKIFNRLAGSGRWVDLRIPLSDLRHVTGPGKSFDFNRVRWIELGLTGSGGGKLLIEKIQLIRR